jgi:plastocyanin
MLYTRTLAALSAAATALALGACGSDEKAASGGGAAATATPTATAAANTGGGGETLVLAADPSGALKFNKDTLSAKAGKLTIKLSNSSQIPHAIEVEGNGVEGKGDVVTKGGFSKVTVDVKPGTYDYYCPVGNHRAAGMEGKLTVK